MKEIGVIVTGCGSPGAKGLISSLRANEERKVRIIGLDTDPLIANRFFVDRFHTPPRRNDPKFMSYVLDLARRENVDIIYPVPTAELEMFAAAAPRFEAQGQRVVVSSVESLTIANNKANLLEWLSKTGLSCVPVYRIVHSWDELVASAREMGYPERRACIKLPAGTGSRGFRILDARADRVGLLLNAFPTSTITTIDELAFILRNVKPFPTLIVMEHLSGDEYDVDVLASDGQTLSIIPRKNELMWYGLSLVSTSDPRADILEMTRRVVASLRLSYVVNATFKMDENEHPRLIEINPRIPGSIIAATMAGVNMPYLAVKMALGEKVMIPPVRWGTKMIRYWDELFLSPQGDRITLAGGI